MAPASWEKVKSHPHVTLEKGKGGCCFPQEEHYVLEQGFAIVRHGDRLDHFPDEWRKHPERPKYPNDCPLTEDGFKNARRTAEVLQKHAESCGRDFDSIICSPYLRCVQTACCIAQKLDLEIRLDEDIGEIFDEMAMKGKNIGGAKYDYTRDQQAKKDLKLHLEEEKRRLGFSDADWKKGLVVRQNNGRPVDPKLVEDQHFPLVIKLPDNKQHRSPQELDACLRNHFSLNKIMFKRSLETDELKIAGKLPEFPEPLDGARIRFCWKVNKIVRKSAGELSSPIIVTHGDAVSAVLGMLHKENEQVVKVPFCGYVIGERKVKVMKKDGESVFKQQDMFGSPEQWQLIPDPKIEFRKLGEADTNDQHSRRNINLKRLSNWSTGSMNDDMDDMDDDVHVKKERSMQVALDNLGVDATDADRLELIKKAMSAPQIIDAPRISVLPANMVGSPSSGGETPRTPVGKSPNPFDTPKNGTASPREVGLVFDGVKQNGILGEGGKHNGSIEHHPKVSCATWLCRMLA